MAIQKRLIAAGASSALAAAGSIAFYFEGEHVQPYVDPVGVLTVCVGHTGGELAELYSEQECTELFLKDLRVAEAAVNRCTPYVPNEMKPPLVSFVFNVGSGNYCSSTLAKKANAGQLVEACKELYRWVYAKGQVLPGLVKRREKEARECLKALL